MRIGILWYDNDPARSLADKIGQAKTFHETKYHRTPTMAMVNPRALAEATTMGGVTVQPQRYILPGHIWIGIETPETKDGPK